FTACTSKLRNKKYELSKSKTAFKTLRFLCCLFYYYKPFRFFIKYVKSGKAIWFILLFPLKLHSCNLRSSRSQNLRVDSFPWEKPLLYSVWFDHSNVQKISWILFQSKLLQFSRQIDEYGKNYVRVVFR